MIPPEEPLPHDHHFDATQQHELAGFIDQLGQEFHDHPRAAIAAAVQTCRTTAAPSYGHEALRECVRQVLKEGQQTVSPD